jgi:L-ascorbate metabolism protein UlaG (beta-lactamase superfamily)
MYKYFIILLLIIALFYYIFCSYSKYYEGDYSNHFDGNRFFDPVENNNKNFLDLLKWKLTSKSLSWKNKIISKKFDKPPSKVLGSNLRVSNVGHVTFLIQTEGINILTDPVWSERASPINFVGPKRVVDPGIQFDDLPPIDIVYISHNHYDHLDLKTISLLWNKDKPRIITPLGNDKIINQYNPEIKVEAYDWGNKVKITDEVIFHIEPMQHWSARGLFDKNKALWAALNIETNSGNIYFVGDSGYGNGRYFQKAKEKFGSFRLALLPIGAYEPRWFMKYSHMNPEEMIKAHIDLGSPYTIPSHYDVFELADEPRGEALKNLEKAKNDLNKGNKIKNIHPGEFWMVPKI